MIKSYITDNSNEINNSYEGINMLAATTYAQAIELCKFNKNPIMGSPFPVIDNKKENKFVFKNDLKMPDNLEEKTKQCTCCNESTLKELINVIRSLENKINALERVVNGRHIPEEAQKTSKKNIEKKNEKNFDPITAKNNFTKKENIESQKNKPSNPWISVGAKKKKVPDVKVATNAEQKKRQPIKPLSEEQICRIIQGRPINKEVKFCFAYYQGWKRNRISLVKRTLKESGVNMFEIKNIRFIGDDIMELLTNEEYLNSKLDQILKKMMGRRINFNPYGIEILKKAKKDVKDEVLEKLAEDTFQKNIDTIIKNTKEVKGMKGCHKFLYDVGKTKNINVRVEKKEEFFSNLPKESHDHINEIRGKEKVVSNKRKKFGDITMSSALSKENKICKDLVLTVSQNLVNSDALISQN